MMKILYPSPKICNSAVEIGKSEKIHADLQFFVAFGKTFFNKHLNWLHITNAISGTYGYSSQEMPLRALLMK